MRVFQPECTLPEEGPAFIQQPNVRSTMDIIWSSLVIILLCSWSITHLNVPPQLRPLPPAKSFWEQCRRSFFEAWYPSLRKTQWMLFNIIVPEFFLGKSLADFLGARQCTKEFHEFQTREKQDDEVDWTLTHSYYANMGGVFVKFKLNPPDPNITPDIDVHRRDTKSNRFIHRCNAGYPHLGPFDWNLHKRHYDMGKAWISEHGENHPNSGSARRLMGDVWVLSAAQLLRARELGIISKLPGITEAQIRDKSKGDSLVKFTAVVQVVWLAIQLGIRAATGRQSSQIEITALAFAVCASITYLLLLQQPKDIQTPTVVLADREVTSEEFAKIVDISPNGLEAGAKYTLSTTLIPYSPPGSAANDHLKWEALGTVGGLMAFGAIHLIAWNFHYPNETERLLWRISALTVTFLPIPITFLLMVLIHVEINVGNNGGRLTVSLQVCAVIGLMVTLFVFLIARLFLLIEAFRSTYYLPPATYIANWASNIPHVG
ncbi:hypothetical protein QBC39DRAFT_355340 [Podospora conica]|nr:hypothetical protein QBC39DRAFT_355340 [Schizothecium conicum]